MDTLIALLTRLVIAAEGAGKALRQAAAFPTRPIRQDQEEIVMKKLLVLLPALLLSACVAAPPTTPQIKEDRARRPGLGHQPAPQFPDDWWKRFSDPQVDRLAGLLVKDNPTLAGAIARIRAAAGAACPWRRQDLPQVTPGRAGAAPSFQQGLHHSAALWRHLALVRPDSRRNLPGIWISGASRPT